MKNNITYLFGVKRCERLCLRLQNDRTFFDWMIDVLQQILRPQK